MSISNPPKGNSDKEIGANFAPLSVAAQQTPDLTVAVRAGSYLTATGDHKEYNGGNATIVTAGAGAEWALVFIAANGTLGVTQQLATAGLPLPGEGELPLAAVYVRTAVATIHNDDIHDVRPLFVAQGEIVVGGIQVALDARYTMNAADNLLDAKADLDGTTDLIFELGQGTAGSDIDLVAGVGVLRFDSANGWWELSNDGAVFAAIGTVAPVWGTVTGTLSAQTDLQDELDLKLDITSFTGHTHLEADITDLQAYLLDVTTQNVRTMADVEGATAATEDQVLAWDDTANLWTPRDRSNDELATWGLITGTMSAQTDLQAALDAKADNVVIPVAGNIVKMSATGDLLDSGFSDTDFESADLAIQAHITDSDSNPHTTTLPLLAGVTISTPLADQVLTYDGANWINQASPNTAHAADATIHFTEASITITASQVSDFATQVAAEPVGTATQSALDLKADIASPVFTGLPVLPNTAKAGLTLGTGLAAEPVGSVVFVTDDAGATLFIMAWVDGTTTWVRSDDGNNIA